MSDERQSGRSDADSLLENGPALILTGAQGLFVILKAGNPTDSLLRSVSATAMNMLATWRLNRGGVRHLPFVGDEAFREAFVEFEDSLASLVGILYNLERRGEMVWPRDMIAELGRELEEAAYILAAQVGGEQRSKPIFDARVESSGADNMTPGIEEMAMAYLRGAILEVAGLALSMQAVIRTAAASAGDKPALSNTERVRKKRQRERRGLRHMIPVSVYDGDLDLLRAFGYLGGHETSDREAIARALEVFLVGSYLNRPSLIDGLGARFKAQMGRIQDLHDDKAPP